MDFSEFKTGSNDITRRLDKVIRVFAPHLSLPEIYKAIRKGLIKVNNKKIKSEYRIMENDIISIASFLINKKDDFDSCASGQDKIKNNKDLLPMPEVVFENQYVLVINKPYNVNVHGDDTSLDKVIENYFNTIKGENDSLSFKPGPLHRLDKKTTGLLVFSMNLEGAHWFTENIQNHNIQKKYVGLVQGIINTKENWTDIIERDNEKGNSFHKVKAYSQNDIKNQSKNCGDTAITVATPLAYGEYNGQKVTLTEFNIKTGRKHQIRAQSSLHNHPLLGDTAYGGIKLNKEKQDFYLTAKELIFPKNNPLQLPEKLSISLPSAFKFVLKRCGIEKADV